MTATITRVPASFRFQSTLLEELKSKAKASNRSLNNYVESLLLSILHHSTGTNDEITPELQAKMDKAREEYKRGEILHFDTAQDAIAWMDAL